MITIQDFESHYKSGIEDNLSAIEVLIKTKKIDSDTPESILGTPVASLLLIVIDSLGAYVREKPQSRDRENFSILTEEKYFGQLSLKLDSEIVDDLYENYRCPLIHSSTISFNRILEIGNSEEEPMEIQNGRILKLRLVPMFNLIKKAYYIFEGEIDKFNPSHAKKNHAKDYISNDGLYLDTATANTKR